MFGRDKNHQVDEKILSLETMLHGFLHERNKEEERVSAILMVY